MESLHVSRDTTGGEDFAERGGRSPVILIVAIIAALAVTGSLFAGYMFLKRRHAAQIRAQQQQAEMASASKPAAPPRLQVFVDDVMLKGPQRVIGGTVLNISGEPISDLAVEMELRARKGGGIETRLVSVEPKDLAPNQQGRYSLKVASEDFSYARILRIKSGSSGAEVAFKSVPGAQRPPEVIKPEVKTIVVKQPPKRSNGEEFINTPDNPARIP